MSKKKRIVKILVKILLGVYTAGCARLLTAFVFLQYRTADARYLRDDLEYLSERMEEQGIAEKIKTHGIHAINHPIGKTAYELYVLENAWVTGYLSGVLESQYSDAQIPELNVTFSGTYDRENLSSPYDALSRLALDTYDYDIADIYGLILLDIGQLSPETEWTDTEVNLWIQYRNKYADDALESCEILYNKMRRDLGAILIVMIPCIIIWSIILAIRCFRFCSAILNKKKPIMHDSR